MPKVSLEQTAPKSSSSKPILFALEILALVGISTYAGYWYGKRSAALPGEEAPPRLTNSSELPRLAWKTFSNKDLKFSFSYMTQYPNQTIKTREASWGRHMDEDIPSFYKLAGATYRVTVSPTSVMNKIYGQKVAGDVVWKDAVNHIRKFTVGSVADSTLMKAAMFPAPGNQEGKVISSRSGELGVETWFVDVPSGTLVHKVAFMVDPEIAYEFRTNYSLLGNPLKWQELKDTILSGTADEQYLLGYENFMLAVSTFKYLSSSSVAEANTSDWKSYGNNLYRLSLKYPSNFGLSENSSDVVGAPCAAAEFHEPGKSTGWPALLIEIWEADSLESAVTHREARTVGHITFEITKESDLQISNVQGKRLDFILEENKESWSGTIFYRDGFSYWVTARSSFLDMILPTIRFN